MRPIAALSLAAVICITNAFAGDTPVSAGAATLHRVLIVGDALTAQYVGKVKELLKGKLEVDFKATPAGLNPDLTGFIKEILAERPKYRLMYVSYGLDAIRWLDKDGKPSEPGQGRQPLDPEAYEKFLYDLYWPIFFTNTKLIFATMVPVPPHVPGFNPDDVKRYNDISSETVSARRITILDLYEYVRIRQSDLQKPDDIMFNESGIELVASVVAARIQDLLLEGSVPGLPYVLVLGDSIVDGYNAYLREALAGKANVYTGGTAFDDTPDWPTIVKTQVAGREKSLGCKFAVIQFNWGIHALKFITKESKNKHHAELATPENGIRCCPLENYGAELEKLVIELEKTDAKLIWAATTPENGRSWAKPGDSAAYNKVAESIMRKHNIPIDDLFTFAVKERAPQSGCHFTIAGSRMLAKQVADCLLEALNNRPDNKNGQEVLHHEGKNP